MIAQNRYHLESYPALTHNPPQSAPLCLTSGECRPLQYLSITFLAYQGAVSQVMTAVAKVFLGIIAE